MRILKHLGVAALALEVVAVVIFSVLVLRMRWSHIDVANALNGSNRLLLSTSLDLLAMAVIGAAAGLFVKERRRLAAITLVLAVPVVLLMGGFMGIS